MSKASKIITAASGIITFPFLMIFLEPESQKWKAAWFLLIFYALFVGSIQGYQLFSKARNWTGKQPRFSSVEARLDELERLKRRDMVTPEEYAAKRQEILKDL